MGNSGCLDRHLRAAEATSVIEGLGSQQLRSMWHGIVDVFDLSRRYRKIPYLKTPNMKRLGTWRNILTHCQAVSASDYGAPPPLPLRLVDFGWTCSFKGSSLLELELKQIHSQSEHGLRLVYYLHRLMPMIP